MVTTPYWTFRNTLALILAAACLVGGCRKQPSAPAEQAQSPLVPCPVDSVADTNTPCIDESVTDLPRFAEDSPFDANFPGLTPASGGKQLWAKSFLWEQPPELVVEKWLTEAPNTEGKCVLIEFWATWCPPCRKSIPLLNRLHERFSDRLAVIGISEENEAAVRALREPAIRYYSAIDTQQRSKKAVGVRGIPHVIILEPEGYVVWEGFPLQQGYELTEETVAKILDVAFPQKP
jgi:thiol-disulfide isomerase/thioredoxin